MYAIVCSARLDADVIKKAYATAVEHESYAQALLDMATAVKSARSRLNWEALAMAKASEVRHRIERILDETRKIPRGLTCPRWAAVAAYGLAAAYLASALQLEPARPQARQTLGGFIDMPEPAITKMTNARKLPAAEVNRLEQAVANNPEDLESRGLLIGYYNGSGLAEHRVKHIFWLLENHPESDLFHFSEARIYWQPGPPLNTAADYYRAAEMWRKQAALRPGDIRVQVNAANFFAIPGDDVYEAERWIQRGRGLQPESQMWPFYLMVLYRDAILAGAGDAQYPEKYANPGFVAHAKSAMLGSADARTLWSYGDMFASKVIPRGEGVDKAGLRDFGERLKKRAVEEFGYTPPPPPTPHFDFTPKDNGPSPIKRVEPVYPALAAQARISGKVKLNVLIARDGTVGQIDVISGHPLLVDAAKDAVKQWIYAPQTLDTLVEVELSFGLK
jgi:TonB family protein